MRYDTRMRVARTYVTRVIITVAFGLGGVWVLSAQEVESGADGDQGFEVLTRGPVHEAFAEQIDSEPTPGLTVDKEPPEPIEELPPEFKPEGEDVTWIPGYWAWDEERKDYIWVSGVWRNPPPDRRWVPGYWAKTDKGYQWVSGFWAAGGAEELEYLDPPPESLEEGPSVAAPSANYFWIPGNWLFGGDRYQWQPGYWHPYQEDSIWVPSRYAWTPHGCLYVSGYWDYRLPLRGCLFSPVYFDRPNYLYSGFYYRPSCLIDLAYFHLHLFARPRYHHYFFGDYFGSYYLGRGYYPHYDYHRYRRGYDCLYTYYRHHYGLHGIDYRQRLEGWHTYYERHREARPPRTLRDQATFAAALGDRPQLRPSVLGRQLGDEVARPSVPGRRFVRLGTGQRRDLQRAVSDVRTLGQRRREGESPSTGVAGGRAVAARDASGRRGNGRLRLPPRSSRSPAQDAAGQVASSLGQRRPGTGRDGTSAAGARRARETARSQGARAALLQAQANTRDSSARTGEARRTSAARAAARALAERAQRLRQATADNGSGGSALGAPSRRLADDGGRASTRRRPSLSVRGQDPGSTMADRARSARDTARALAERARNLRLGKQNSTSARSAGTGAGSERGGPAQDLRRIMAQRAQAQEAAGNRNSNRAIRTRPSAASSTTTPARRPTTQSPSRVAPSAPASRRTSAPQPPARTTPYRRNDAGQRREAYTQSLRSPRQSRAQTTSRPSQAAAAARAAASPSSPQPIPTPSYRGKNLSQRREAYAQSQRAPSQASAQAAAQAAAARAAAARAAASASSPRPIPTPSYRGKNLSQRREAYAQSQRARSQASARAAAQAAASRAAASRAAASRAAASRAAASRAAASRAAASRAAASRAAASRAAASRAAASRAAAQRSRTPMRSIQSAPRRSSSSPARSLGPSSRSG